VSRDWIRKLSGRPYSGLAGFEEDTDRIGRELPTKAAASTLSSRAILFADDAAPCQQALGRMLIHTLGKLRRAHQASLHRDFSELRTGDGQLAAICQRGETAEHGDGAQVRLEIRPPFYP
jgi:hypothetical protein